MVFYRKYRPQSIEDLDSKHVRDALTAVLSVKDTAHAFLFTGPKGLGKTSTARIVAKAVNCEQNKFADKGKSIEPCNACQQCESITNGTNVDIIEIDGASNRNIDDVRDLKEKIKLSPASARKKVYIIDEVHMFTTDSFNALLKTLEEPPAHAMFILCTTEKHKVPATIVSRCFLIEFKPATNEELARSFKRIAKGEGLTVTDDAIEEIGTLADGGFRDAHKVLEELSTLATDKIITKELIEKRYKTQTIAQAVIKLGACLAKRDTPLALSIIAELVKQGVDVKHFLLQLTETVHRTLLKKAGVEQIDSVISEEMTIDELRTLLLLLSTVYTEMKTTVIPQLPLELAIITWELSTSQPAGNTEVTVTVAQSANVKNAGVTVTSMRKQLGDLARVKALYGEPKQVKSTPGDENTVPKVNLMNISNSEITPEWLQSFWSTFIAEMKQYNHTVAGVLRGCMIKSYDQKLLIIETAYAFHMERLKESKNRESLEKVCKILTGNTVTVEVVLRK